ncbi:acetate--CoA ligase family protein [Limibacillus halophilus]|uniref:Acetyltransferase n=1 Tax=Limibacillus halophilus TaxID=1579333 RepID=A0A839SUC5_9PROT|nr:acetate--CoA ligase [Limibacillus halophilus]MBB3064533.1 acetyltransferase [Limibacillus halophilus]
MALGTLEDDATAAVPGIDKADGRPAPTAGGRTALDRLVEPHSVAIVGASANPDKRGYQIIKALKKAGYAHAIYPVNPRGGSILDVPVVTSIAELPDQVDVAVIVRPAEEVADILIECGQRGVAGAVVLAHGFRERGDQGAEAERQLQAALVESGVRIIGPNTSGMLNCTVLADLIGLPELPPAGPVSVLTQSGNMILSVVEDNRSINGPGFDLIAGLGNQSDAGYAELIGTLSARDATRAIAIYSEGFPDGRGFLDAADRVARTCPIVMLRGGRSAEGQKAALSHTGSIAGADAVATSVLRQKGVTLVDRSDELLPVAALLATAKLPDVGKGVVVLADGGGHATLAVDALSRAGLPLSDLSDATQARLRAVLGLGASVGNPIDVASAADAYADVFADCIEILAEDPSVGLVLVNGLFGAYHIRFDDSFLPAEDKAAERLVAVQKAINVPLVFHSCYADRKPDNHDTLRRGDIQVFPSIDVAVAGASALYKRAQWLAQTFGDAPERAGGTNRVQVPGGLLPESVARRVLQGLGVSTGTWSAATDAASVRAAIADIGTACAVKVDSSKVVHKSDVGGVHLGVTVETAADVANQISESMAGQTPPVIDFGYLVAPMVKSGVELFVGAINDPVFGPVVLFGTGGVLVEAADDVAFRAAPITPAEAMCMIAETRVSKLLDGFRSFEKVDTAELAAFIASVSEAVSRLDGLSELDINPVIASRDAIHPVDVRLVGK